VPCYQWTDAIISRQLSCQDDKTVAALKEQVKAMEAVREELAAAGDTIRCRAVAGGRQQYLGKIGMFSRQIPEAVGILVRAAVELQAIGARAKSRWISSRRACHALGLIAGSWTANIIKPTSDRCHRPVVKFLA
jgi:hypothetical protein